MPHKPSSWYMSVKLSRFSNSWRYIYNQVSRNTVLKAITAYSLLSTLRDISITTLRKCF